VGSQATFYLGARLAPSKGTTRGKHSGRQTLNRGGVETMAVKLDEIRTAAARVAASHGLDVVDIEFIGPAKERTLRIYLEKNAEGRAHLEGGDCGGSGRPMELKICPSDCGRQAQRGAAFRQSPTKIARHFSRDFGRAAGCRRPDSRRGVYPWKQVLRAWIAG